MNEVAMNELEVVLGDTTEIEVVSEYTTKYILDDGMLSLTYDDGGEFIRGFVDGNGDGGARYKITSGEYAIEMLEMVNARREEL